MQKLPAGEALKRKRARNRAYMLRWRLQNPKEASIRNKNYRNANKAKVAAGKQRCYEKNRSHYAAKWNKWKKANQARHDAYHKKYREVEWKRFAESNRKYRKTHPEICKRNSRLGHLRRRARKYKAQYEDFHREEIYRRDGGICWLCKSPVDEANWHLDHKIPLAKGGHHLRSNVAVSHPLCNQRKNARIICEINSQPS